MKATPLGEPSMAAAPVPTPARIIAPEVEHYAFASDLVMLSTQREPKTEQLRRTATEIYARHFERGRRGLAVCSASRGTGVSFMTANLAIALSQLGAPTVIVDANLTRPRLEELIQPDKPPMGLRQAARGEVSVEDLFHEEVLPNLSVVYAGGAATDDEEVLESDRFREVIDLCLRDYRCTLVDTAAANRTAGARSVASVVGYALLVARGGQSYAEDLEVLVRELSQDGVGVIGSVLNAG